MDWNTSGDFREFAESLVHSINGNAFSSGYSATKMLLLNLIIKFIDMFLKYSVYFMMTLFSLFSCESKILDKKKNHLTTNTEDKVSENELNYELYECNKMNDFHSRYLSGRFDDIDNLLESYLDSINRLIDSLSLKSFDGLRYSRDSLLASKEFYFNSINLLYGSEMDPNPGTDYYLYQEKEIMYEIVRYYYKLQRFTGYSIGQSVEIVEELEN